MFRAAIQLPADLEDFQIAQLSEGVCDGSAAQVALREGKHTGPWRIEWIIETEPNPANENNRLLLNADILGLVLDAPNWDISAIDTDTNWLEESYKSFQPFSVGPFFIYGSHYDGDIPSGQMGLQIDAATAFGSGEHGTTKGCLQAMLDLKGIGQCPWNVLDMGTGSGILAIAAWKLWKTPILASDIDEECIVVTKRHADLNGVQLKKGVLSCAVGDGFATDLVQQKKPYDLVIANILAGPLIDMAADLEAVTDTMGYIILSGMLQEQAQDVLAAYEAQQFTLKKRYDVDEWSTLVLQKQS